MCTSTAGARHSENGRTIVSNSEREAKKREESSALVKGDGVVTHPSRSIDLLQFVRQEMSDRTRTQLHTRYLVSRVTTMTTGACQ